MPFGIAPIYESPSLNPKNHVGSKPGGDARALKLNETDVQVQDSFDQGASSTIASKETPAAGLEPATRRLTAVCSTN